MSWLRATHISAVLSHRQCLPINDVLSAISAGCRRSGAYPLVSLDECWPQGQSNAAASAAAMARPQTHAARDMCLFMQAPVGTEALGDLYFYGPQAHKALEAKWQELTGTQAQGSAVATELQVMFGRKLQVCAPSAVQVRICCLA